jgi:hypothetical protein
MLIAVAPEPANGSSTRELFNLGVLIMATSKRYRKKRAEPNIAARERDERGYQVEPKHGFYSRLFKEGELIDLQDYVIDGLMDEIAPLRVRTRRIRALGDGVESLDEAMGVLGALGMASLQLANILRIQKLLGGTSDEFERELIKALDEIHQEMNIQ